MCPIGEEELFTDAYVSVRIGEQQKISRLTKVGKTFKFPEKDVTSRKHGRLDIFQRVGGVCFGLNPADYPNQEVSINAGVSGNVKLRVDWGKDDPARPQTAPASLGAKAQAAKDYLTEHSIELRLHDAMQALLRERPVDPMQFMTQRLLDSKTAYTPAVSKPAVAGEEAACKATPPRASQPEGVSIAEAASKAEEAGGCPYHLKPSVGQVVTSRQGSKQPAEEAGVGAEPPAAAPVSAEPANDAAQVESQPPQSEAAVGEEATAQAETATPEEAVSPPEAAATEEAAPPVEAAVAQGSASATAEEATPPAEAARVEVAPPAETPAVQEAAPPAEDAAAGEAASATAEEAGPSADAAAVEEVAPAETPAVQKAAPPAEDAAAGEAAPATAEEAAPSADAAAFEEAALPDETPAAQEDATQAEVVSAEEAAPATAEEEAPPAE